MPTHGFITFVAGGRAKHAYCHADGGPYDLGVKVLRWLRTAAKEPRRLEAAITALKVIADFDSPRPTPEEVSRLQRYSDPSVGNPNEEWYALLHDLQGDPAALLASGCIVDEGSPHAWAYEVNSDEQTFSAGYADDSGATWPWSALPTDHQLVAAAEPLDPNQGDEDDEAGEDDEWPF